MTWVLEEFAKLRKSTLCYVMSLRLSVRPHGTNRLPLDGFSWNLIFGEFSKIYRENSIFIKLWQEYRAVTVFFFENRTIYEKMWKNIVELDRPQMAVWCMRIACWIPKATKHTLRICNTHCFSTTTVVERTRLSVSLHVNNNKYIKSWNRKFNEIIFRITDQTSFKHNASPLQRVSYYHFNIFQVNCYEHG
jgi:hypothetical protein